jgi:hypothetical protein
MARALLVEGLRHERRSVRDETIRTDWARMELEWSR